MPKKKQDVPRDDYQGDVLDLFRKIIGTVQLSDIKNFDELTGQDRINFLKFCTTTFSDPFFMEIIKHLLFEYVVKAANESRDMDQLLCNRAGADGVRIVQDFFAKYNKIYKDEFEKDPEVFNPHKAFEPVEE